MTPSPNPEEVSALLVRVKGADKPSPELDARILCVLAAPGGCYVEQSKINGAWCIFTPRLHNGDPTLWERHGWYRPDGWPVTASLDAAIALAERKRPGCGWEIDRIFHDQSCSAHVFAPTAPRPDLIGHWHAIGPTPALALITALLESLSDGQ